MPNSASDARTGDATLSGRLLAPFVLVASGQSNLGFDTGGPKTVDANILIGNSMTDPTAFVPPVFGSAPLILGMVGGVPPLAYIDNAADSFNNIAVQFANMLRRSDRIPASRPIVILPNWFPGQSITHWVNAGPASRFWKTLRNQLRLLEGVYPGSTIDHVIWAQGESDADGAATEYNTKETYAAAFGELLRQFRALPQWRSDRTTMSVQELATWSASRRFQSRNDFLRTLGEGKDAPEITLVSAEATSESRQTGSPHFDGSSLIELAGRHFGAWLAASPDRS